MSSMHRSTKGELYAKDDYYEAVLQIRPKDQEVLDFVKEQIKNSNECLISKEEEVKTGYDLHLTSQRFGRVLIKRLKHRFKGEINMSSTLFGVSKLTSKELHRVTFLFRKSL